MTLKVGIAGLGTIGTAVARRLVSGIKGLELSAVTSGDQSKAANTLRSIESNAAVVSPERLADLCNIVVECAPTAAFLSIATPAMKAGRHLVTVSAAALIENMQIVELAEAHGGRILMASGALLGFDAVRAAAKGEIISVTMITRKPPKSLVGAPYLDTLGLDVTTLTEATKLFDGTAREGARGFPANVNVAAALALAGIGPDKTRLQIWADPALQRNTHVIRVEADSARFEMSIENVPSLEKPGTGRITALSMVAALEGLTTTLKIGS